MDDDVLAAEPARSAGGSNVSSLQPQPAEADEDDVVSGASEESDGRAMAVEVEQPVMQTHHVEVAAPASEAGTTPRYTALRPINPRVGMRDGFRAFRASIRTIAASQRGPTVPP